MSSQETIREDRNATVRENQNTAATLREGQATAGMGGVGVGSVFQGYRIVRQLPTKGSEADIFIVEKDGTQYILKQYRYGIEPKRDILLAIKALSESHPHEFVRLFDTDFDPASGRWYEIQEYVANGSLQSLMADRSLLTGAQQATFFTDVARELADDLHALHENNLLHLDLKPSNILLRSIHPLNLALIDFGIATALDPDMSKKFTQVRGTPMYQSPESYSGGMGRPADWWSLGMILLEIAAGSHPFKGLSNNIIAYAISTEPVPVPEDLDAGQKELLQGLLTRSPEKRWGYEQVVRWLSGERSIPQHFETVPATQAQPAGNASLKSLKFMDRQYQSLAELAAAFLKDEQAWEKGKGFLLRGYVRQWLEKNEEFDAIMDIDEVLSGAEDPDEKLFRFTQRFGGEMPFAFGGHLITLENLLIFAGKVLQRQPVTAMEQKIADSIANGLLLSCLNFYGQQGRASGTGPDLGLVLESLKEKPQEYIAGFLDVCLHPENYYCPFLNGNTAIENIVKNVPLLPNLPVTVKEHERRVLEEQRRKALEEQRKIEEKRKREREREQRLTGIYNGAVAAMNAAVTEESFKSAAKTFKTISEFKDADALAGQCLDKAEVCRKDAIYASAKSQMTGNTVTGYESAIKTFSTISGWKDADEQICACQRKIEEIKIKEEADRLERERKAEEKRIADEKAAKKRTRIASIVVVTCIAFFIIIKESKYNVALNLYNARNYNAAYKAFNSLHYKDSSEKASECLYNAALDLYNTKNYNAAYKAFNYLHYKDSSEKSAECLFLAQKAQKVGFSSISVGSMVKFGYYEQDNNILNGKEEIEWKVLAVEGNKALLISEYALDSQRYDSMYTDTTWEKCTLRTWLNGTFYNAAFGTDHQKMIVSSTVTADKNPSYGTSPGNTTTDKVFLLSIAEANRYFSSDSTRQCRGTAYCHARGAYKGYNGLCWWWLRSPGSDSDIAARVGSDGSVRGIGYGVNSDGGAVRPALWVNLPQR